MHRILIAAALLATSFLQSACSKPTELQKITIIYPTRTGQVWPLYMTKEGGYYEKYGFDATLTFGAHPVGITMVISDQAAMTPYTLEQAMQASLRDGSLVAVGSPFKKSLFALMAAKNIKSMKDLKGRTIGVTQLADAPYNYTTGLLAKVGLTPRDVTWIPTGGAGLTARAAALASGRVDATMLTAPNYFALEAEGYQNLGNISDYDDIFAPSVYLFKKAAIEKDPTLAERLIKAHAEGIKRFYDDKAFAVQAHLKWDPQQTQADLERVYDHYRRVNTYERVPYILSAAVKYILDHPSDPQIGAEMQKYDFRKVLDNSIVDRLVKEGFFEQLYGPEIKAEQDMKATQAFR